MDTCDCAADGYCPRYGRDMGGRFREICAGINIDLGTAAAFRLQWSREAPPRRALEGDTPPIDLLLKTDQAPGDAVAMTAAIYSLHRAHPGKYRTAVESFHPDVFAYNPDVVPAGSVPHAAPLAMHYPAIHDSNRRAIHFMQGWCEFLGFALGVDVPLLTDRPHLYFPDPEPWVDKYWVVCSGGKGDLTCKRWDGYQEVVDRLSPSITFHQVGAAKDDHPRLRGTVDRVGSTSLRELFNLVRWSRGVLCGVSLLMHVAAALNKPAVVVAGGREPVAWNAYPRQVYIHDVGALGCRSVQGEVGRACWRSRVVPLGDSGILDANPCEHPAFGGQVSECMARITAAEVASAVSRLAGASAAAPASPLKENRAIAPGIGYK